MNDTTFNFLAITITIGLTIYGGAILWLHTWLRTLERTEHEDNND